MKMKNNLRQLRFAFNAFMMKLMYGRNGFDNMARACYGVSLLLLVINIFAGSVIIYFLWVGLFAYSLFRSFSRNIPKRYAENQKYLQMTRGLRGRGEVIKLNMNGGTSRFYLCSSCGQKIRVPKGKGKIEIRCPRCGNRFIKKT